MSTPCLLCGETASERITTKGDYTYCRCTGCGLVRVDPFPTKEQLDRYYSQAYNQYRYSFATPIADVSRKKLRYLKTVERFHARSRLLDVGCAYGHFLDNARFHGWRVEGVEPLNDARILARSRFGLTVHDSIEQVPAESFDAVTLWHVIEHVTTPHDVLRSVHQRLVRGGVLGIATPNIESLSARLTGASWAWLSPPDHVILYSPRTLAQLLEQSGFEVLYRETGRGPARNILLLALQGIAHRLGMFRQMKASVEKAVYAYQTKRTLRSRFSIFRITEVVTEGLTFVLTPLIALLWKMGLGDEVLIVARKK
jgi:SAM-dependent methyltransferase